MKNQQRQGSSVFGLVLALGGSLLAPSVAAQGPITAPLDGTARRALEAPATLPLDAPAAPAEATCARWLVDYALGPGTRSKVTDTLLGAGDGEYETGPGKVRLRFTAVDGQPAGGSAELLSLEVAYRFAVETNLIGLKTRVLTDAVARHTPDAAGVVARGTFDGARLAFREQARAYRTTGTLTCTGVLCGRFGAPPSGISPVGVGPYPVSYPPFVFTNGVRAFTMDYAEVARSSSPRQRSSLRLVGREVGRRCVPAG